MEAHQIRARADEFPRSPGVYRFLDGGTVLYVGKAVDLRARVRSYADPGSERSRRMIRAASAIDIAVTDTETQALLLEANLIKRHHPRYNVRLKDDKSYPLVQLTDHEFPRIEVTRDPDDSATVFGPFTDKGRLDTAVKALRGVYGVRGCSDHKFSGRERPCLDYDIGLCTAPCTGEIGRKAYLDDVGAVERFFEGETGVLTEPLESEMADAVADRAFERAATVRDRLQAVRAFHEGRGGAVSDVSDRRTVDVLGGAVEGDEAIVARLHSDGGKLVERDRHRLSIPDAAADTDGYGPVLSAFISQYYAERDLPDAVLVSEDPADDDLRNWLEREGVDLRVPATGRESTLVELAVKNARRFSGDADEIGALAAALDISRPRRIEGFDISHAQGKATVGSNVAFVDGSPDKSGYRRLKLDDRNDDYANMRQLVEWRALRAVEGRDDRPDPDLVIIDGGSGQLSAARSAMEAIGWPIPVVGLAKPDDVVITPNRSFEWPPDAPELHVLQRVRDEAHRFAVRYHQTVRDDIETVLDDVPGVGPTRRNQLLRRFGSVEGIRRASTSELQSVPGIGPETADRIHQRL